MPLVPTTISCRLLARTLLALAASVGLAAQDPVPPLPPAASQELPAGIRWSVAIPAAPSSSPVIAGTHVFLATLPGLVTAYDLKDGREVWRETIAAERPLVASGEMVFVAAGEAVHALRQADGGVAWRRPTGTLTAPLMAKDGWVIAAAAQKLFALRASDGAVVWSIDSGPQQNRGAIEGDTLFVPLANGFMRALDLASGALKWERRLGGAPAEPLVVGDRVYVGATDKYFYCLDATDGEVDWPIRVGASMRGRAATDGHRVFFTALDNLVRAVDRQDGAQRWQQGVPFRPFTGPVVASSSVLIAGPASEVQLLNPVNGTPAGKIAFPEALSLAPTIASLPDALVLAGVTGGLTESWKLWLATPDATKKVTQEIKGTVK